MPTNEPKITSSTTNMGEFLRLEFERRSDLADGPVTAFTGTTITATYKVGGVDYFSNSIELRTFLPFNPASNPAGVETGLVPAPDNPRGAWVASGRTYVPKDTVTNAGKTYRCARGHVSSTSILLTNETYWELIPAAPGTVTPPPKPVDPPGEVTNFRATTRATTSLTFNWNAVSGATSYLIEIAEATNPTSGQQISGITNTSRTVTGLQASRSYIVTITAINAGGNGPESSPITVTTRAAGGMPASVPPAPTGLSVSSGNRRLGVSWNNAQAGVRVDSWTVLYSDGSNINTATVWRSGLTTNSTTITGLQPGTVYRVWVRGVNAAGTGPAALDIGVTTGSNPFIPDNTNGGVIP